MQPISPRQLLIIGVMYVATDSIINIEAQISLYAKNHLLLSHAIAFAWILPLLWLICRTIGRFPDKDLFQAMVGRFPLAGRVTVFLYVLFFFYIVCRDVRSVVEFANAVLLPTTPLYVIAALLVSAAIGLAYGGIEIVARVAELTVPVMSIATVIVCFALSREYELMFLQPLTEFDVPGIAKGSWLLVAYFGEVLALAFVSPGKQVNVRSGLTGFAVGAMLVVLLATSSLLTFGHPILSRLVYPSYELVRQLRITDFLDRFDLPLVGIWMPVMLTKTACSLYIVCSGIKRIVPHTSGQRMVIPVGLLALSCSFWFFDNVAQLVEFNSEWPAIALIFEMVLPILLFFVLKPKNRRKRIEPPAQGEARDDAQTGERAGAETGA